MNKSCKNVFTALKKESRKFKTKNFNKKNGLYKFYTNAKNHTKKNKDVFTAFQKASKQVKPYTHVNREGLVKFFNQAKKNYKGKTCKKVFSSLSNTAKLSRKTPQHVNQKMLNKFYSVAEKKYLKN